MGGPGDGPRLCAVRCTGPLDCKRADVPNTMAAYASAVFDAMHFDAATVHAYHGADSIAVFADYTARGVYVVCHTSNPAELIFSIWSAASSLCSWRSPR